MQVARNNQSIVRTSTEKVDAESKERRMAANSTLGSERGWLNVETALEVGRVAAEIGGILLQLAPLVALCL